jgi:hypothetical protein
LKQTFLYFVDLLPQYENLVVGLRGGEVSNTYAQGYEQSPQAELYVVQSKGALEGAPLRYVGILYRYLILKKARLCSALFIMMVTTWLAKRRRYLLVLLLRLRLRCCFGDISR